MSGTVHLETFIITVILLTLYPGQDFLYIISSGIARGRRAGILSALGIITGGFIHAIIAVSGLSSILAASQGIFYGIKIAGMIYLVYLGVQIAITGPDSAAINKKSPILSDFQIYRRGLITNLLNVKVILFFVSFLPQFIHPVEGGTGAFLLLGSIFLITGILWWLTAAYFASKIAGKIKSYTKTSKLLGILSGFLIAGTGIHQIIEEILIYIN